LRARVRDAGLEAVLVTRLVNVRYLTGFTGSNAALLVPADGIDVLCTDGRYTLHPQVAVRPEPFGTEVPIQLPWAPAFPQLIPELERVGRRPRSARRESTSLHVVAASDSGSVDAVALASVDVVAADSAEASDEAQQIA